MARWPSPRARVIRPGSWTGWLRPGAWFGLPLVWAVICLGAIPIGVYVVSYIPWALIENHRLWDGLPAGNTGQTLIELTGQMYNYHNSLSTPHAASSPWWAWPFDLKPVWFYQESLAGGTSAALYDAGNLVIWWLGVPALAFASIMAFRRRSLGLALIAIGFAAQWVSWARIDRAAFQYHYYTALPFVILALAYLGAELCHLRRWAGEWHCRHRPGGGMAPFPTVVRVRRCPGRQSRLSGVPRGHSGSRPVRPGGGSAGGRRVRRDRARPCGRRVDSRV